MRRVSHCIEPGEVQTPKYMMCSRVCVEYWMMKFTSTQCHRQIGWPKPFVMIAQRSLKVRSYPVMMKATVLHVSILSLHECNDVVWTDTSPWNQYLQNRSRPCPQLYILTTVSIYFDGNSRLVLKCVASMTHCTCLNHCASRFRAYVIAWQLLSYTTHSGGVGQCT